MSRRERKHLRIVRPVLEARGRPHLAPGSVEVRAHAKVNLHLRVLARRPDGYHDVETVLQSISLADRLVVARTRWPGVDLVVESAATETAARLPRDPEENLAVRAARAFLEAIGAAGSDGLSIRLVKELPVGAGLGGGSADAAAVLRAASELFRRPLDPGRIVGLAAAIGADVPFCLTGGVATATGKGDRLTFLAGWPRPLHLVLITPPVVVATGWAYEALDSLRRDAPDSARAAAPVPLDLVVRRLVEAGAPGLAGLASNDFEPLVSGAHDACRQTREALLAAGARWALLAGSGSSVFGVFEEAGRAVEAARRLRARLNRDHQVHACEAAPPAPDVATDRVAVDRAAADRAAGAHV